MQIAIALGALVTYFCYHCVCWNFWADLSPGCWAVIHVSLPLNTGQFEHLSGAFYSGHLAQV